MRRINIEHDTAARLSQTGNPFRLTIRERRSQKPARCLRLDQEAHHEALATRATGEISTNVNLVPSSRVASISKTALD